MRLLSAGFFGVFLIGACGAVLADEVKVLGGSALITAMDVLIPRFERASGHKVVADFDGAIGAMAKRVEAGEAADVLIVSRQQLEALAKAGKVQGETVADLAKLGVGVFVRKGAARPDIGSVEAFKRTMLAAKSIGYNDPAAGAPVSLYLIGAFQRLGIGEEMARKTVVFKRRDERFAPVARGEVEIGFNQVSEIIVAPGVELVGPLPADIQNYTFFAAGVVAGSRRPEAARRFVAFVSSPEARAVLKEKGFD